MDRDKRWVLFCLVKLDRILKRMGIGNWELKPTNQKGVVRFLKGKEK